MMNRRSFLLASATLLCTHRTALADAAGADLAQRLFVMIDGLDVADRWLAGSHVNWETGLPDGGPVSSTGVHSHCSAFVAAAAERAGIYILRPPEHGQVLLANAQYDWLAGPGAAQGWSPLADMYAAQEAANDGQFTVACYRNRNDRKPGHIAIVRPSQKQRDQITAEGPDITQAGLRNYVTTTVSIGFADHRGAFSGNEILYYAHTLDPAALSPH